MHAYMNPFPIFSHSKYFLFPSITTAKLRSLSKNTKIEKYTPNNKNDIWTMDFFLSFRSHLKVYK